MVRIDEELIQCVVRTIVERFEPERIILFGSHARGDAGPESDLDLFVEMESPLSPPRRAVQVDSAFGPRLWPLDVFVYTPQEVSRLKHMNGTLVSIVEREGVVLYERSRV